MADTATQPRTDEREEEALSVSQLNAAVRKLIERRAGSLLVQGEIANFKQPRSGHLYFSLRDEDAQVSCVMWRRSVGRLPVLPEDGMEVRVTATPTIYEARGNYQLRVDRMEATGEGGLWKIAFEKLRQKLETEGLLAPERKRKRPRFPHTIGVVTSSSGAALHDILQVLTRRAPWVRVVLSPAQVQGEGSAAAISEALERLYRRSDIDVIICGRGGGSIEDLWAFNEEAVARALARSPVPLISAVGHETDVTIADLIADFRAPTPSAGAECATMDAREILEYLTGAQTRMVAALRQPLRERREEGDRLLARMERALRVRVRSENERLRRLAAQLNALSPLASLERGYAVLTAPGGGTLLRSIEQVDDGDRFDVRVRDGIIEAEAVSSRPDRIQPNDTITEQSQEDLK